MATDSKALLGVPDPARPPLKVNVFDAMCRANSALMPLFPYLTPGSIVPTGSVFRGGPGKDYGVFEHFNTVDEVSLCFCSQGARIRPGQVYAGARKHRVGGYFVNNEDPDSFLLVVVTQRQAENDVEQHEAISFRCGQCQHELFTREFNAKPCIRAGVMPDGHELYLDTIVETLKSADLFNEDRARRLCPQCGHENPRFPVELWGWRNYHGQIVLARDGWRQYAASFDEARDAAVVRAS